MSFDAETNRRHSTPQAASLDWLADFVIPAAVFGLLGSLLYFLIDLRQYLVGGEAAILRYVVFWFLIGVIGLARLSARPGISTTPPIVYAAALAGVVAWVTVMLSQYEGPLATAARYRSPGLAVLMNLTIVAGIWAAAWFLTSACTRPEHALEELRSGGVAAAGGFKKAVATPLRAVLVVSGIAVAAFGYGLSMVNPISALRAHAFICASLFLLFAMLLMALVSLGAARLAAHQDGLRVRRHIVGAWVAGAAVLAIAALFVAAALPEVASRLRPRPQGRFHYLATQKSTGRGVGTRSGTSSWVDRVPGGARRLMERLMRGRRRQPGAPPKRGEGGSSPRPADMPLPRPPRAISWLWWLLAALFLLALLYRLRRLILAYLAAFYRGLLRLLAAIAALFSRLLRRPAMGAGDLPQDPWADIFASGSPEGLDPAMAVRHVWRAIQLYYDGLGDGRREQETEMEFARRARGRFSVRPDDVRRVAMLYCAVEYGGAAPSEDVVRQMRELWVRLAASAKAARDLSRARAG